MNKFTFLYGSVVAVSTAALTVGTHLWLIRKDEKNSPDRYKKIQL